MDDNLFKLRQQNQEALRELQLQGLSQPTGTEIRATNRANELENLVQGAPNNLFDAIAGGVTKGLAVGERRKAAEETASRADKLREMVEQERKRVEETQKILDQQIEFKKITNMTDAALSTAILKGDDPAKAVRSVLPVLRNSEVGRSILENFGIGEVDSVIDGGNGDVVITGSKGSIVIPAVALIADSETRSTVAQPRKGKFKPATFVMTDGSQRNGTFDEDTGRAFGFDGEPLKDVASVSTSDTPSLDINKLDQSFIDSAKVFRESQDSSGVTAVGLAESGKLPEGGATLQSIAFALASGLGGGDTQIPLKEYKTIVGQVRVLMTQANPTSRNFKGAFEQINALTDKIDAGVFKSNSQIVREINNLNRFIEAGISSGKSLLPHAEGKSALEIKQNILTARRIQAMLGTLPEDVARRASLNKEARVGNPVDEVLFERNSEKDRASLQNNTPAPSNTIGTVPVLFGVLREIISGNKQ